MAVVFTMPCPGFVVTRRSARPSEQTPAEAGVVHRRSLRDYELRSWVLRWESVPIHIHNELERLYEDSEHGILPFLYQPPEESSPIEVTMLAAPTVDFLGPSFVSFEVEFVEIP